MNDIIHHELFKKLQNISYTTLDNIIFYGPNGSGKYTLFNLVLNHIVGKINIKKRETFIFSGKEITIITSPFHYEIFLDKKKYDKTTIIHLLDYLTESKPINNLYRIIFFKNAQYLCKEILSYIKNNYEKKHDIVRYIFTMNSIANLEYKSFFMLIRVPLPTQEAILNVIKNNIFSEHELKEIIIREKRNLTRILFLVDNGVFKFSGNKLKQSIIDIIKMGEINSIEKLRVLIYELVSKNYNKINFIKQLFNICCKDLNKDYIDFTVTISNKMVNSYKDTIHLEYYCVKTLMYYNRLQQE